MSFGHTSPAVRIQNARRIFNAYLKSNAEFPIHWPSDTRAQPTSVAVQILRQSIESQNLDAGSFNDMAMYALKLLEKTFLQNLAFDDASNATRSRNSFSTSIAASMMRDDLGNAQRPSSIHLRRCSERLVDFLNVSGVNSIWSRLTSRISVALVEFNIQSPATDSVPKNKIPGRTQSGSRDIVHPEDSSTEGSSSSQVSFFDKRL